MQRINTAGAITGITNIPGGKKGYSDGTPGVTAPTSLDAAPLNALQEELSQFIESMSITVLTAVTDTFTQLQAAVTARLAAGTTQVVGGGGAAAGVIGNGGGTNPAVLGVIPAGGTGSGVQGQGGTTGGGGTFFPGSTSGRGVNIQYANNVNAPLLINVQASVPTGPNTPGDICVTTGGVLQICTVAGSPGTWVHVGAQT